MAKYRPRCAFPAWMFRLPIQQQSVMLLAARGPDGVAKHHPCKAITRSYRGTVLLGAYYGRHLTFEDPGDTFMTLLILADGDAWNKAQLEYFAHVDSLPHHYHLHLLHGAQILGYKHPDPRMRARWIDFYLRGCDNAHMNPETIEQMDARLCDWNQEFWGDL